MFCTDLINHQLSDNRPDWPTGGSTSLQKNEKRALIPAALKAIRDVLYALIFSIYPRDCNV